MKERIVPILALVVLFALVGTMAYFGSADTETSTVVSEDIGTVVPLEEQEEVTEVAAENVATEKYQFKTVETPELILTYEGEAVKNNYNYATFDRYTVDDYTVAATVSTDAEIDDTYYELVDESGNVVYKGQAGLSGGRSGDLHQIAFNKLVFSSETEDGVILNPEWKDYDVVFYLATGYDTSIIVKPV